VHEFLEKQAPDLTLHPLLTALRLATKAERIVVRQGLETLERLMEE